MEHQASCDFTSLVLLIEPDPIDASLLQDYLAATALEVFLARNLREARSAIEENRFDLVLINPLLPDASVTESVSRVTEWARGAAVIVLGSPDGDLSREQSLSHGAQGWLDKQTLDDLSFYRTLFTVLERRRCHLQFRWLLEQSLDAILVTDELGGVIYENALAGLLCSQTKTRPEALAAILPAGERGPTLVDFPSGRAIEIRSGCICWLGRSARLTMCRDMTVGKQIQATQEWAGAGERIAALIDPQTRLLNRSGLDRAFNHILGQARILGTTIGALLIDNDASWPLDEEIDRAMHTALLQILAARLLAEVRGSDLAGRIGDDRFLVLLPGVCLAEANQIASRIRAAISGQPVKFTRGPVRLEVNIGTCLVPGEARSLEEFLAACQP